MTTLDLTLTLVSPAFIYGAYQRGRGDDIRPEMRGQSVRGQLRYWLRAIIGAQSDSLSRMWERESAVFGSTGAGSVVSVRVYPPPLQRIQTEQVDMLPHRTNPRERSPSKAISVDQKFSLQIVTRPGVMIPDDALAALKVWSLLGGVGKRSRRMFGAIRIGAKDNPLWYAAPKTADDLAGLITQTLTQAVSKPATFTREPAWPTLHPKYSWVVVGREAYENSQQANAALFNLLRGPYREHERSFGHAMGGRRASPLHAQVRRIGTEYYPVLTALRAGPTDRDIKWDVVARFMKDAEDRFNGTTVWGGW